MLLSIIIRLLSLASWRAAASMACAYLALLSMMPSILWPICISVISWPVACLASAMNNVLFFRGGLPRPWEEPHARAGEAGGPEPKSRSLEVRL